MLQSKSSSHKVRKKNTGPVVYKITWDFSTCPFMNYCSRQGPVIEATANLEPHSGDGDAGGAAVRGGENSNKPARRARLCNTGGSTTACQQLMDKMVAAQNYKHRNWESDGKSGQWSKKTHSKCPAVISTCSRCGKSGHSGKMCTSRLVSEVTGDERHVQYYLSSNNSTLHDDEDWAVTCNIGGRPTDVKIDPGSVCCVQNTQAQERPMESLHRPEG